MTTPRPEPEPLARLGAAIVAGFPQFAVEVRGVPLAENPDARATIHLNDEAALLEIVRAPRGLGFARAWAKGTIDVTGDIRAVVDIERQVKEHPWLARTLVTACAEAMTRTKTWRRTGPTDAEYTGRVGLVHSIGRDRTQLDFHYGLPHRFFELLLGENMTYSCAMPETPNETDLAKAQDRKNRMILRKLATQEGQTLLDIGCGWGELVDLAGSDEFRQQAFGLTAVAAQAFANQRKKNGVYELGDWRTAPHQRSKFDNIASVGMYEHVGRRHSVPYFRRVKALLQPNGTYVHQCITRPVNYPKSFRRNSFVQRYVFPNGQLQSLPAILEDLETAELTVKNTETFGWEYAWTTAQWLKNLEQNEAELERLVGRGRTRSWRLYLAASAERFARGDIALVQIVAHA